VGVLPLARSGSEKGPKKKKLKPRNSKSRKENVLGEKGIA
jgi:hypothetical protein